MNINEYVVSGTPLQCTLGTEDSTLNVVVPKALTINDKYVATQTDCQPFVNIGSFGMCLANPNHPRECNPSGCWVNVRNELIVDGVPALTRKSKIICTTGCGEITIVDNEESKNIKIYTDIFGEKYGRKLGKYVYKLGKLNENGLAPKDREKFERLMKEFQELFDEAGGMKKVLKYNKKICKENGITEKDFHVYEDYQNEKKNKQIKKEKYNEKMAKRFDSYGIDRNWYSFEGDSSKMVWCDEWNGGNRVRWQSSGINSKNSKICTKDEVFDCMLDKLLLYKKRYEFEQGERDYHLKYIEIQSDEIGCFSGCRHMGEYGFIMRSVKGDKDENLISKGYNFSYYDQYMGDFVYSKLVIGSCAFTKLKLKVLTRDSKGKVEEKSIVTDISDETRSGIIELRRGIIDWIHENENLQIENNDLYEKIEDYLKSEGYITQKRPDKCKDVCDKTTKNHCGDSKLEVKVMPVSDFMKTAELADNEKLKMMYSRISDNIRKNYIRLDYGKNPLYKSGGGIYGGGDCVSIISHREGYGYTIIEVGDRGSWICAIRYEAKGTEDIAFYDGEFEEVYEKLIEYL